MPDIDDVLRRQDEIIDRAGWAVMLIVLTKRDPDTATTFAHTVGLTAHSHPELLIAGLPPEVAHGLLNDLAGRVYDTAVRFSHGQRISDLIADYNAVIVDGPLREDLLPAAAITRYGREPVHLQQIVWPDPRGQFPWDQGYDLLTLLGLSRAGRRGHGLGEVSVELAGDVPLDTAADFA